MCRLDAQHRAAKQAADAEAQARAAEQATADADVAAVKADRTAFASEVASMVVAVTAPPAAGSGA